MPTEKCEAKHTQYQPSEEDFVCPKCDAKVGDFYIYSGPNTECDFLHAEDILRCAKCDHEQSGSSFAKRVAKLKNMHVCPTCKGVGMVAGNK